MVCPKCRAGCATGDIFCHRCGTDLSVPSRSLVPVQTHLPMVLSRSPLPQVAAGVGAVAVGVGLELLRRGLLVRSGRRSMPLLSMLSPGHLRRPSPAREPKPARLPRGYEVQETVIYIRQVIRRRN